MARRNYGRELWDRMVDHVRQYNDSPCFECGEWTIEKLYFLSAYLAQTTQAMKGNPHFKHLNYIDLFASSGVCQIGPAGTGTRRYPGSSLLAAGCEKPFNNLFLVERDTANANALGQRVAALNCTCSVNIWNDDANKIVERVAEAIPDGSLNIAFVDPFSLDVHYETIRTLAQRRPLDLLILFADDMDILRNVRKDYYPGKSNKLDLFLGTDSNWRAQWDALNIQDAHHARLLFSSIYTDQLSRIGYTHADSIPIPRQGRPLYRLIYASKHPLGLKFWNIARREDLRGNRNLWGES